MNTLSRRTLLLLALFVASASAFATVQQATINSIELTNVDDDDSSEQRMLCGNGVQEDEEECDDGLLNGQGFCRLDCTLNNSGSGSESGFSSSIKSIEEIIVKPTCGNGVTEGEEQCDDGNGDNLDFCLVSCKLSFCGDGLLQAVREEQCDDGNRNDEDKCSNKCQRNFCGDRKTQKDLGEECDDGDKNGTALSECSSICKKRILEQKSSASTSSVPSQQSSVNNEKERQEKAEKQRLEQLREQAEKQRQLLEEQMRQAREQREQLQEQGTTVIDVETEPETETETEEPESALVCFDAAGNLVSDRQECAPDQEKFVGVETTVSDDDARKELRKQLLGDNAAEVRSMTLIATMEHAKERLQKLLETYDHREEVRTYLQDGIAWLDRGIAYFAAEQRSLDEVQQMVPPVKQLLAQAADIVQAESGLPDVVTAGDVTPILQKVERLLLKFRESFIALAQGGIELNKDALEKYVEAAEEFNAIANTCSVTGERCSEVHNVLELLKVAQGPLQDSLGKNPEIYQKVQEKFAE